MIAMPQMSTPLTVTLSETSKDGYTRRCNQLIRAAKRQIAAKTGQAAASVQIRPGDLVDFVIARKNGYRANSWRQVRRCVTWSLEELASSVAPVVADMIM